MLITLVFLSFLIFNSANGALCNETADELMISNISTIGVPFALYDPDLIEYFGITYDTILTASGFYFSTASCIWTKVDPSTFNVIWSKWFGDLNSYFCWVMTLCPNQTCLLVGAQSSSDLTFASISISDGSVMNSLSTALTGTFILLYAWGSLVLLV